MSFFSRKIAVFFDSLKKNEKHNAQFSLMDTIFQKIKNWLIARCPQLHQKDCVSTIPWLVRSTQSTIGTQGFNASEYVDLFNNAVPALLRSRTLLKKRTDQLRQECFEYEKNLRRLGHSSEFVVYAEKQRRSLFLQKQALRCWKELVSIGLTAHEDPSSMAVFLSKIDRPVDALSGFNLLSYYVGIRDLSICATLLELGANPHSYNENGLSSLEIARRRAESFEIEDPLVLYNSAAAEACAILALLERDLLERAFSAHQSSPPHPTRL